VLFQIRLKKEQEEKEDKRRYKAQAHLYTIIKVMDSYLSVLIFKVNCLAMTSKRVSSMKLSTDRIE
jgi:hypothetical protein